MSISIFNQIDPKKIFDLGRIFETTPESQGLYQYLAVIFGLIILATVILIFQARNKKPIFRNFYNQIVNLFLFTGITGEILIFCRWQGIPYLGSRLMLYILGLVFIIWGGYILWFRISVFPGKIKQLKEKEKFEKYLPKKRKVKNE